MGRKLGRGIIDQRLEGTGDLNHEAEYVLLLTTVKVMDSKNG